MKEFKKNLINNLFLIDIHEDDLKSMEKVLLNKKVSNEEKILFKKEILKILKKYQYSYKVIRNKLNKKHIEKTDIKINESDLFYLIDYPDIVFKYPYIFNSDFTTTADFKNILKELKEYYLKYKKLLEQY